MRAPQIEEATNALERATHEANPEVVALFVKPQTAAQRRANPYGRAAVAQ